MTRSLLPAFLTIALFANSFAVISSNTNMLTAFKIDLNRISLNELRSALRSIGISGNIPEKLVELRAIRGELSVFDELLEAGLTSDQVDLARKHFFIESRRKDPEETIRDWSAAGLGSSDHFYGLLAYPMDLNAVRTEYLGEIPCIGPSGALKIDRYRRTNEIGALLDLTNAGLRADDLLTASPFVTLKPVKEKGLVLRSDIVYRSEDRSFADAQPDDENTSAREAEIRLMLEVRPARIFFATSSTNVWSGNSPLSWNDLDRNSRYYAFIETENVRLVTGYFKIAFGQHLLFGPSFSPPVAGIESFPGKKSDRGVTPGSSLSVDVDGDRVRDLFRGIAVSFDFRDLDFFGYRPSPRVTSFLSSFDADPVLNITNQTDYGADLRVAIPVGDSFAGLTAARQSRADGKFDSTGLSFHYECGLQGLDIFGEIARYDGMAALQGLVLGPGFFRLSLLGFYAAPDFNAPNASDIIHAHKDSTGFFAGAGLDSGVLRLESYADLQWNAGDFSEKSRQRYQGAAKLKWKFLTDWWHQFEAGIRTRYSDLTEGINLRTYAELKAEFLGTSVTVEVQWQDLVNLTERETGNMLSVRLRFVPFAPVSMVLRWNGYLSAGYDSALFDTREAVFAGDLAVIPYYGAGNEWTAMVKWKVTDEFSLNGQVRADSRELEPRRVKTSFGFTLFAGVLL